jgi:hypothetical protein
MNENLHPILWKRLSERSDWNAIYLQLNLTNEIKCKYNEINSIRNISNEPQAMFWLVQESNFSDLRQNVSRFNLERSGNDIAS